jgi:thiamine biosynthesis lipoprotein
MRSEVHEIAISKNMPRFSRGWRFVAFATYSLALVMGCKHKAHESHSSLHTSDIGAPNSAPSSSAAQSPEINYSERDATASKVERKDVAMGTSVRFIVYPNANVGIAAANTAIDDAMQEVRRLEALLSEWRDNSDVGRVNQAAGEWVSVAPETAEVIDEALWISRASHGAFDITFHAMSGLWKFGTAGDDAPQIPPRAEVERRRSLINYRRVEFDPIKGRVRIPSGRKIGLGGIAKGYIVDRAVAVLRRAGLKSFLVQAGGDLYGAGRKPDGSNWVTGIQDPRGPEGNYFATVELEDHAFSTAGDYARSYVINSRRYHHIIDPRTGYPATASRSVTVYAPDALSADMIDDAVFIMGPDEGLALADSLEGVGVVIVDAHNKVWLSPRLTNKVTLLKPPTDGI